MDVWTLGEKYKKQAKNITQLEDRVKYLEDYLSSLTQDNKGKKDENIQDKKSSTSGVRTGRRTTKKS